MNKKGNFFYLYITSTFPNLNYYFNMVISTECFVTYSQSKSFSNFHPAIAGSNLQIVMFRIPDPLQKQPPGLYIEVHPRRVFSVQYFLKFIQSYLAPADQ